MRATASHSSSSVDRARERRGRKAVIGEEHLLARTLLRGVQRGA